MVKTGALYHKLAQLVPGRGWLFWYFETCPAEKWHIKTWSSPKYTPSTTLLSRQSRVLYPFTNLHQQIPPNQIMYLSNISCVLALASTVFAGQCYNHNEGAHKQKCVHKEELAKFAEGYCHDHWSKLNGDWTDFNDRSGNTANIGKVANFSTKESCVAVFSQIVENCYDGWDGGQWVADGVLLNINFCKWSSEAKGIRFQGLAPPSDARRVRYEGLGAPADAKRVRYEGLPPPADAKRVAYQGLRVGKDL